MNLHVPKYRRKRHKLLDYSHKFFEFDAIVSGRSLPPNSIFTIQIRDFTNDHPTSFVGEYYQHPTCIIRYFKNPTFFFKTRRPPTMLMTHPKLKRLVTRTLKRHGLIVNDWQPTIMHKTLNLAGNAVVLRINSNEPILNIDDQQRFLYPEQLHRARLRRIQEQQSNGITEIIAGDTLLERYLRHRELMNRRLGISSRFTQVETSHHNSSSN
jgi:hypothetical protein